jgi:hypothetical protein
MNEPQYAIWLHKSSEEQGFLQLYSDGIVKLTNQFFKAKLMPSKEHAIKLLNAVIDFKDYLYIEIIEGTVNCNVVAIIKDESPKE